MKLILTDLQPDLARAWAHISQDLDFVSVFEGSIFDVSCDAVVSPANSFGFMNGGIDLFYSRFFGCHVQERLQQTIRSFHHGELLVGAAEIISTDHERIPYMIAAPTMRMPMGIKESINPYLAARATLLLWKHGQFRDGPHQGAPIASVIETIALPGLGTGVGGVEPEACARQVRGAIEDVVLERFRYPDSWAQVLQRHEEFLGQPLTSI